jgi:hypothetical protein
VRDRSRVHAPWIFRRQPAIPTPDLFTVQAVVPSDPASGNQSLQHNLRLTLGSGLITAMLAVSSQIHDLTSVVASGSHSTAAELY